MPAFRDGDVDAIGIRLLDPECKVGFSGLRKYCPAAKVCVGSDYVRLRFTAFLESIGLLHCLFAATEPQSVPQE